MANNLYLAAAIVGVIAVAAALWWWYRHSCDNKICVIPAVCNRWTGKCVDRCASVKCTTGMVCDPQTGMCGKPS